MPATKKIVRKPVTSVTKKEIVEHNILDETTPRKSIKPYALLILGFLLVVAFYGKQYFVAALVNNKPILRVSIINELEKQGGQQALDSLVTQELIKQEGAKQGTKVTEDDVNKKIAELDSQFKVQGQSLDKVLEQQGLNRDAIKEQLQVQIMLEKLLGDKVNVTEKEVDEALEKQKELFAEEKDQNKVRTTIRETLKSQKLSTEAQTLLAELKKSAKINQFVAY